VQNLSKRMEYFLNPFRQLNHGDIELAELDNIANHDDRGLDKADQADIELGDVEAMDSRFVP